MVGSISWVDGMPKGHARGNGNEECDCVCIEGGRYYTRRAGLFQIVSNHRPYSLHFWSGRLLHPTVVSFFLTQILW